MTTHTHIKLTIDGELTRVYNTVIHRYIGINLLPALYPGHMSTAGTMTAFAINPVHHPHIFVFRSLYKIRIRIVTAHTFQTDLTRETGIETVFKTGRQIPLSFLCIKRH